MVSTRTNEWNATCGLLSPFVSDEYELHNLSESEVDRLLALLERHGALGRLANRTKEERREDFIRHAQRQILVALHEATLGRDFEDIIRDEYESIRPDEARRLYMTICALNRMDVPVRAGVISRLYSIDFNHFKERFFEPLENVVRVAPDPISRDHVYLARHPHIAQIVFQEGLSTPESRFEEYRRCLGGLNLWYKSDRDAFDGLVRARSLIELFPDAAMVHDIYALAEQCGGELVHLNHQKAIYEMNRQGGDLKAAEALLAEALEVMPNNFVVLHSLAELKVRMVDIVFTGLEKKHLLDEAEGICRTLTARSADAAAQTTLVKCGVKRVEIAVDSEETMNESDIQQIVRRTEDSLEEALQSFPNDTYLRSAEAQLATVLANSARAIRALEAASQVNPGQPAVAVRLARMYEKSGDVSKAEKVLRRALELNESNTRLNFAYARLLLNTNCADNEKLVYYLRRSYVPGDRNYDAQRLHARQLYIADDLAGSKAMFTKLGKANVPFETRSEPSYPLSGRYFGNVVSVRPGYCFVAREGQGDGLFAHCDWFISRAWEQVLVGSRVSFEIAFSMRGPAAVGVDIA